MGCPKRVVFVRHAESEGNVLPVKERPKFNKSTHLYNLTERGQRQAEITGAYLKSRFGDFDYYYSSYYERAMETMRIMYPEAPIMEEPRVAEIQRGIWHALTDEQVAEQCPWEVVRKEREGYYHYRPQGGQNWPDVEMLARSFGETLNRERVDRTILVTTHNHWLQLWQKVHKNSSWRDALERYMRGDAFQNASVTIYERNDYPSSRSPYFYSRLILTEENIVPWVGMV